MADLFKQKWDKADMEAADDPQFAPAVVQVPSDDPRRISVDMRMKRNWPQHVVNVTRPRYGHDY